MDILKKERNRVTECFTFGFRLVQGRSHIRIDYIGRAEFRYANVYLALKHVFI